MTKTALDFAVPDGRQEHLNLEIVWKLGFGICNFKIR